MALFAYAMYYLFLSAVYAYMNRKQNSSKIVSNVWHEKRFHGQK